MQKIFGAPKGVPKNYFRREKLALKICGLSFTGNESKAYKIYSFFIILIFNYVYLLLQLITVVKEIRDNCIGRDTFIYQFATFLGTVKMIVALQNRIRIGKMLDKLEKEPFALNQQHGDDVKEKLIKECVFYTTVQISTYWISLLMAVVPSEAYSIMKRIRSSDYHDWGFPFGSMNVVNVTYSPNYEISLLHQIISIQYFAVVATTIDLIIASTLCHLCYQFKILQFKFRRLVEDSYQKMCKDSSATATTSNQNRFEENEIDPSTVPWKYLKQSLKEAVDYHLAIIGIAEEMENIFSGLLLVVCFATLGMMGIMVYRSSLLPLNDPGIVRSIVDTFVSAMQVLVVCFWGEQVIHESQQVGSAAWETNFVGSDIRFQKALVVVIRRSQIPTKLRFGKFSDACIATFTWLLQSTYSAFMLLRNTSMQDVQ